MPGLGRIAFKWRGFPISISKSAPFRFMGAGKLLAFTRVHALLTVSLRAKVMCPEIVFLRLEWLVFL